MVDRGGCSFVTKARNAQALGASALVAADTRCVCGQPCEPQKSCQWTEPVLADDGSGADVTIPAIMLQKQDADAIKDYIRCGKWGKNDCTYDDWSKDTVVQASLEYTVRRGRADVVLGGSRRRRGCHVDISPVPAAAGCHVDIPPTHRGTAPRRLCRDVCRGGGAAAPRRMPRRPLRVVCRRPL